MQADYRMRVRFLGGVRDSMQCAVECTHAGGYGENVRQWGTREEGQWCHVGYDCGACVRET